MTEYYFCQIGPVSYQMKTTCSLFLTMKTAHNPAASLSSSCVLYEVGIQIWLLKTLHYRTEGQEQTE